MAHQPPTLLFTLRGHESGVTALAYNEQILISGDEKGNIHFWSALNFRLMTKWTSISDSRIQSLKVVKLPIKTLISSVLVCQTRDEGVKLIACDNLDTTDPSSLIVQQFPTYDSLFARGDALTIDKTTAILAYPSNVDCEMVAVRFVGPEAAILSSGNAARHVDDKTKHSKVFDIKLLPNPMEKKSYLVFAGYEDGALVIYGASSKLTKTVLELNVTGLKLDVIKKIDLGFKDFVSAFDVQVISDKIVMICGSPQKDLSFCSMPIDLTSENVSKVALGRRGVSAIAIHPDEDLVVVETWDKKMQIYSMKSRAISVPIHSHNAKVETIMFMRRTDSVPESGYDYWMCCASLDWTISVYTFDHFQMMNLPDNESD